MAWRCSSTTNLGMVQALRREGLIKTAEVAEAMTRVDRGWFVRNTAAAYLDQPLPIGFGVTISAPHMHAMMLELVSPSIVGHQQSFGKEPRETLRILDIGSGSGYMTAAFAALCETGSRERAPPKFEVVGIEHVPELQKRAEGVLNSHFPEWYREQRVLLRTGDGLAPRSVAGVGGESGDAFDVIHVGATAPKAVIPEYLRLLRNCGTLVIPVGHPCETQELQVFTKSAQGDVTMQCVCHVQFVPLTSLEAQLQQGEEEDDPST